MDARDRLQAYPGRAPFRGLVLMFLGFAGIVAGIVLTGRGGTPVLIGGSVLFLSGQVWQGLSYHRWRSGFLKAMADATREMNERLAAGIAEAEAPAR